MTESRTLEVGSEAAAIQAALARAQRKLARVRADLEALKEATVKAPGEVEALEKRRAKLLKEEEALRFRLQILAQSLGQARERERQAEREKEEKIRAELRPEVEKALADLEKVAVQFGKKYQVLLDLARKLPKCDRLAGPVWAAAAAAILAHHPGKPRDQLDIDAQRVARLAGFSRSMS